MITQDYRATVKNVKDRHLQKCPRKIPGHFVCRELNLTSYKGETVIFNVEVRNSDGDLVDPDTMKITISSKVVVVNNQDMIRDSVGVYHYNYTSVVTGPFIAVYTAVDYGRVSKAKDNIQIVN